MSHDLPPVGFEPHDRKSPLTAPWEPIYRNAQGAWVVLGVQIRAAHTNSRGLVHGGLVYRSSVSGRIVTERYAEAHPETTQQERRAVVRPASRPRTEASA